MSQRNIGCVTTGIEIRSNDEFIIIILNHSFFPSPVRHVVDELGVVWVPSRLLPPAAAVQGGLPAPRGGQNTDYRGLHQVRYRGPRDRGETCTGAPVQYQRIVLTAVFVYSTCCSLNM